MNALAKPHRIATALDTDAMVGAISVAIFILIALLAPALAPYDPHEFSGRPLERPSASHWLGTNDAGQDILSELIYGARISIAVGIGAALGTVVLGLLVGGMAGYAGGALDVLLMRTVDVIMTLPRLPLLILLAAFLGSGMLQTMTIISLLFWPATARVIRAQVQSLRAVSYTHLTLPTNREV